METTCDLYDALAGLLAYPDGDFAVRLQRCRERLAGRFPEAAGLLARFAERMGGLNIGELEELYTRTFDLDPVASLEVGWHLFGENYSRGEFLVTMRQLLRKYGLPEATELPDHLTQVLPTVARMDQAEADRFTTAHVLPALGKMLAGLGQKESPYADVLETVRTVLTSPYAVALQGVDHD
ncbi:MAG: nitrate reductase molybdenum cofactor assembly chaperone [Gemmataceae bacterium]|nr:nitrate reductase molybdenum cofactor assembly chaperone [Gemmataceae bacterium]